MDEPSGFYRISDGWFYLAAPGTGAAEATGIAGRRRPLGRVFADGAVEKWVTRLREAGVAPRPGRHRRSVGGRPPGPGRLSIVRDHAVVGSVRIAGQAPRPSRMPPDHRPPGLAAGRLRRAGEVAHHPVELLGVGGFGAQAVEHEGDASAPGVGGGVLGGAGQQGVGVEDEEQANETPFT